MFQILIVEDDVNARKLMEAVISQYGYQPIVARDAMEGAKLMESRHIDLIVRRELLKILQ